MKSVNKALLTSMSLLAAAVLSGCGEQASDKKEQAAFVEINKDPFPSSYKPLPSKTTLIKNVNMYDGLGGMQEGVSVLLENGKIAKVAADLTMADDVVVIDGKGKWLTPGIIDVHSHLGVYATPDAGAHADGNEMTKPVTAAVWAEHSIWPQDPGFRRALAGGVTAMQILPGSANLVGGRSVTVKNLPGRVIQDMKFPDAPYGLKMACGENPKRVYGQKGGPMTRMGNVAGYRQAWSDAQDYKRAWEKYENDYNAGKDAKPPKRDLNKETLMGVLDGEILVHMHCYRADDMGTMIDVMKEFDYQIASFQHAVEAYKIADLLAENNICSAMWADWWGFKMEAYDGIRENVPMVHAANACAIVHSDSDQGIQRLNQEAAKALSDGQRAGIEMSKADAWIWLTSNAAKSLGIFEQTGSIEEGKNADVVLWNNEPFSTYAQAELVFIDGGLAFDRNTPKSWAIADYELGQVGEGDRK